LIWPNGRCARSWVWHRTLADRPARKGCKATGIEPNLKMLEIAGEKIPWDRLVQGRAESLPWKEETQFKDVPKFMAEVSQVLKKNGGIMVTGLDPHTGLDSWWIYDYFPQVVEIERNRFIPAQKIRQMMVDNGLVECSIVEAQHMQISMPAREALESEI
jgi:ubiquinone/menaquinone biosynthesis C-methylase UbiE